MFGLTLRQVRMTIAGAVVGTSLLVHTGLSANAAQVTHSNLAALSASADGQLTRPFPSDDPIVIRDAFAEQSIDTRSPTLGDRFAHVLHLPSRKPLRDVGAAKAFLDRDLAFIVPVNHGIVYRAKARRLMMDIDLSGDGTSGMILLKKTVTGPSGRALVVAAEAKSKGYIQHIDFVELDPGEARKTMVHGRVMLSQAAFSKANEDFAIVLICRMVPPYLTDQREHTDPSDEEPTDITTRTSTLHAKIRDIWLVSPRAGVVLATKLHLSK